jgi:Polysaccharide deacetylase
MIFSRITLIAALSVLPLAAEKPAKLPDIGIPQSITVRTTENVTKGGWVWLLKQCEAKGISRVDLLMKQDEDHFHSERTGATLESGELLVPLPGEKTATGWEDAGWLREMLASAKAKNIKIWAWWPCFHDAQAAALFPQAAYSSKRDEKFVDPGYPEVRDRQAMLISKLLNTYEFDGVSLDWIRYDGWQAGTKGPLGTEFAAQYHTEWAADTLDNGYTKARWYEARAKLLAKWVSQVVQAGRGSHPSVGWGAFVLPWQFSETSQDYAMLSNAGLDFLQPMGYWPDWKQPPEWVGDRVLSQHRDLANGTSQWPTLGVDAPISELALALDHIPQGLCSGVSWFTYGTWEQKTFDHLHSLLTESPGARRLFGYEKSPQIDPLTSAEIAPVASRDTVSNNKLLPKVFPLDSSMWSTVCLAELYKRGALSGQQKDPVVPVLALHTFIEGKAGQHDYVYKCSTEYLDSLLEFISASGFTVCPFSRLQGYLITHDASYLPPRPLVITIDDGSRSVYEHFYPRAVKRKLPFTLALVTSWLSDSDKSNHATDERGKPDPSMTWGEATEMNASNLMEVVSHSDAMHYQTAENPLAQDERPAEVIRQYLSEYQRTETNDEYARRIRIDMITSRRKLTEHGFRAPTTFCWPYGEWCQLAKSIGEQAGFTHFLLFDTPPIMASAQSCRISIPRIVVIRVDESIPLVFPADFEESQAWWLAFLKVGRDSCNIPLMKATIAQLTAEAQRSPEVEMSRAVIDYLRGNNVSGTARLAALREAYPFTPAVTDPVGKLLLQFTPRP